MTFPPATQREPEHDAADAPAPRHFLARGWCFVLALAVAFVLGHALAVSAYLKRVSNETFRAPPALELPSDITLGIAADSRTWLRLTEERLARGDWRFSRTEIDGVGAEGGREVLWHSAWSWWMEALGRARALLSGEPLGQAIARASHWAHLPWLLALLVAGGLLLARCRGAAVAAVFVAAVAGHRGLYIAFYPGYPDHHGWAALAALGVVGGLFLARWCGSPVHEEKMARLAVLGSAASGAFGLAVSASSSAPLLAVAGVSALLACGWAGGKDRDSRAVTLEAGARLWSLWGRVGASLAIVFYLLEMAPDRFAWRLEVNHPAHALAWWGGAELIAWWWRRAAASTARDAASSAAPRFPWWAAALVSAPLVVVIVSGGAAFGASDAFLQGVHRHIDEFKPVWAVPGSVRWLFALGLLPLVLLPFAWRRAEGLGERPVLVGLLCVGFALTLLAAWQHRWWSVAASAQILAAACLARWISAGTGRPRFAGKAAIWALVALCLPSPVLLLREQWRVARVRDVQKGEAMQILFRDIAWALREAGPAEARLVVVGPPNASLGLGYHGAMRAVGTLYWENHDGLRAAARVLTAADDEAAREELLRLGATHLALVDPGDFTAEYHEALGLTEAERPLASTLGRRLLEGRAVPAWARALPYAPPPQFARLKVRVALYAFEPALSPLESGLALGIARLVAGEEVAGRAALREAALAGSAEAALFLAWRIASGEAVSAPEAREAVHWAERAVAALPESPSHRRVLAAAYASARRWPEAQATLLRAIEAAEEAGDRALLAELERDFVLYRDGALRGGSAGAGPGPR